MAAASRWWLPLPICMVLMMRWQSALVPVSGIVVLVGLDCGQTEGDDREGKSACYKVVQDLLAKSKEQNGSIICAEILGLKGHEKAQSSYVASARTAEYYKSRPCAAKVESAARIFAEYLMEKK